MWKEINDQADIDRLLESYGYFHDSCIRDIYISTREFVDEELSMNFDNELTASLLFQRQSSSMTILELKFEDVAQFNFRPDSGSLLFDAILLCANGLFYWADYADWEIGDNESTWISGKKVFWRTRPELVGNINRLENEKNASR